MLRKELYFVIDFDLLQNKLLRSCRMSLAVLLLG